jgi:hypothetical protein
MTLRGVWYVNTATRIGPIFLDTVSSERYIGQILVPRFDDLNEEGKKETQLLRTS